MPSLPLCSTPHPSNTMDAQSVDLINEDILVGAPAAIVAESLPPLYSIFSITFFVGGMLLLAYAVYTRRKALRHALKYFFSPHEDEEDGRREEGEESEDPPQPPPMPFGGWRQDEKAKPESQEPEPQEPKAPEPKAPEPQELKAHVPIALEEEEQDQVIQDIPIEEEEEEEQQPVPDQKEEELPAPVPAPETKEEEDGFQSDAPSSILPQVVDTDAPTEDEEDGDEAEEDGVIVLDEEKIAEFIQQTLQKEHTAQTVGDAVMDDIAKAQEALDKADQRVHWSDSDKPEEEVKETDDAAAGGMEEAVEAILAMAEEEAETEEKAEAEAEEEAEAEAEEEAEAETEQEGAEAEAEEAEQEGGDVDVAASPEKEVEVADEPEHTTPIREREDSVDGEASVPRRSRRLASKSREDAE